MSSHTDGLGCLECGQWVCECESDDDYWKQRAEKAEARAEALEFHGKEQGRMLKEAEAENRRLRNISSHEICGNCSEFQHGQYCNKFNNYTDWDNCCNYFEKWKAQQGGEG